MRISRLILRTDYDHLQWECTVGSNLSAYKAWWRCACARADLSFILVGEIVTLISASGKPKKHKTNHGSKAGKKRKNSNSTMVTSLLILLLLHVLVRLNLEGPRFTSVSVGYILWIYEPYCELGSKKITEDTQILEEKEWSIQLKMIYWM